MPRVNLSGLALHYERSGRGPSLLLLHGFTGSSAQWGALLRALAEHFDVIAVDLIGHARSDAPADPLRYGFARCVADLTALLDALGIGRTHCLGYSMGGRLALALALAQPHRIERLVLESASPGLADTDERRARGGADARLADRIESGGVPAFVDEWMAQPLFATQSRADPARRATARNVRLSNTAIGLANCLRGMGTGVQPSLWGRLGELRTPTLLLTGELDAKFRGIAERMREELEDARLVVVPDAGHATHFEAPERFLGAVMEFLAPAGREESEEEGFSSPSP